MIKQIGNATLYLGDCQDILATIRNVDVVITSPPYNKAGYEGFIRKKHEKDSWGQRNVDYGENPENDFMPESDYQNQQIKILNLLWDCLSDDGSLFYNHKIRIANHKASHPIEWLLKSKFVFRQQLIWDRSNSPAVAPIRFLPTTELIFWMTKLQKQPNFERSKELQFKGEVWKFMAKSNSNHPAPFPLDLPINILSNILGEIIVLDPYMGSGTTGVACAKMGKTFVGIEKEQKYFDIACQKIEQAYAQADMFVNV
jgi:site-specific DNA-methyltransferase (adenine-specific)